MPKRFMKYNPAFLSEQELINSFVVRLTDFELMMNTIRENVTSSSNQHILVVGSRGSGKTTLVQRVAVELRRAEDLRDKWYPLIFAEESYEVGTIGEFWLAALFHLKEQTGGGRWLRSYDELREEKDDKRLQERALALLLDFADSQGKRILLIVENLNMLLGDQISKEDAWALRHTLLNEPRIMLLATATSRFDAIDKDDQAMFELFKVHELKPLTEDECKAVWRWITGQEPKDNRIRPLQILTGGNPRLMAIISNFGAGLSFSDLMNDLIKLVDDHTEYFKNHLDNLPPVERKVYLALLELWDPATARDIAQAARLDVSKTSSLLKRLSSRGAVLVSDDRHNKWYQVAERMYNIYYLMRKRGAPSDRVKAVVSFMVNFYDRDELVQRTSALAVEACHLSPELRTDNIAAYKGIVESLHDLKLKRKIFSATPRDFGKIQEVKDFVGTQLTIFNLLKEAVSLSQLPDKLAEAETTCRNAIQLAPHLDMAWGVLGFILERLKRYEKAEEAYRKAIDITPEDSFAWEALGRLLEERLKRYEEAEQAYRKAIAIKPVDAGLWLQLGRLLHERLNRYEEAEQAYRKAIAIKPEDAGGWAGRIVLALKFKQPERALVIAQEGIQKNPGNPDFLNALAWEFYKFQTYLPQAATWAQEAVRLAPDHTLANHTLACILCALKRGAEALAPARQYLQDTKLVESHLVERHLEDTIELLIRLAAAGCAREALDMLQASTSVKSLESMVVALRLFLKEDVKAAAEILEVAKDVVKRIQAQAER